MSRIVVSVVAALVTIGFLYFTSERQEVPVTGREQRVSLSDDQQMQLGEDVYRQTLQEVRPDVVTSGRQASMVAEVAERIAEVAAEDKPEFEWEVTLVEDAQANAFCLPGGKIVVYTGIVDVAGGPGGLATVIGHEVAHATAEHGAERIFRQQLTDTAVNIVARGVADDPQQYRQVAGLLGAGAQVGLSLPWSRDQESEADRIGLIYMARAGFDPRQAVGFWQRMEEATAGQQRPPEYLNTHPSSNTRIQQIRGWLPEALEEFREE
jgi:predicted Zn-dependent protease